MAATLLKRGESISVIDYRCTAGSLDKPFVESNANHSISYVRKGSFGCTTRGETFDLVAGSVMVRRPVRRSAFQQAAHADPEHGARPAPRGRNRALDECEFALPDRPRRRRARSGFEPVPFPAFVRQGRGRDAAHWLAWSAQSPRLTHHNASMQVFDEGAGRSRAVWIADLLPKEIAPAIAAKIDQGMAAMKKALEAPATGP